MPDAEDYEKERVLIMLTYMGAYRNAWLENTGSAGDTDGPGGGTR